MKKFFNFVWIISIGVAPASTALFVGAMTADGIPYYAGIAIVSTIILATGLIVGEIDRRAFDRGYETADSIRIKEQEERDG